MQSGGGGGGLRNTEKSKTSTPGCEHKALDGRKIFTDHVTKPTHYNPPGIEPAPPPPGQRATRIATML